MVSKMNEETKTKPNQSQGLNKEEAAVPSLFPFQLVDVRLFSVSAERYFPEQEGEEEASLRILLIKGDEPISAQEFGLRLEFAADLPHSDAPECSLNLSIEGYFRAIVDPLSLKPEIIERFKTSDAVLLLWPYLRETLHNIAVRMRIEMAPLPVIDARALLTQPVDESVSKGGLSEEEAE